jgi:hypothetical protein
LAEVFPQATVANKPGHRGEHEVTVKTIAQGRLDCFGEPVVTTLVCLFHFACEAAGAAGIRLSLRPLMFRGQEVQAKLARTGGEIAKLYLQTTWLF